MKNLKKVVLAALSCCALASCGGTQTPAVTCVGAWTNLTGAAVYANAGYSPAVGIAVSSADSVTVFSDNTYTWVSKYTYEYTTDGIVWVPDLAEQAFTFHGTCEMVTNTDLEETTLTIKTVTDFVAVGANWNCDTKTPDDRNGHGEDVNTEENLAKYVELFQGFLSKSTYTLNDGGKMDGNALFMTMLTASSSN